MSNHQPYTYIVALFFTMLVFFISCGGENNISTVPEIALLGISKDTILQSNFNEDSLIVRIAFIDGDGDLGNTSNSNTPAILIKDSRTGEDYDVFSIPSISQGSQDIRGEMTIRLFSTCCIFDDGTIPCGRSASTLFNDLELSITLIDRASNMSNTVTTPTIKILCN